MVQIYKADPHIVKVPTYLNFHLTNPLQTDFIEEMNKEATEELEIAATITFQISSYTLSYNMSFGGRGWYSTTTIYLSKQFNILSFLTKFSLRLKRIYMHFVVIYFNTVYLLYKYCTKNNHFFVHSIYIIFLFLFIPAIGGSDYLSGYSDGVCNATNIDSVKQNTTRNTLTQASKNGRKP